MAVQLAKEIPAFIASGARVSWGTWGGGVATVTVTSVTEFRVFYVSDDGVGAFWEASCYRTLLEALPRDLCPAHNSDAKYERDADRRHNSPGSWHYVAAGPRMVTPDGSVKGARAVCGRMTDGYGGYADESAIPTTICDACLDFLASR